jgi:hypothetical protein
MNTLPIEQRANLNLGLRIDLAGWVMAVGERIADWHHQSRQRELEAYLDGSQNMADLEQRLQKMQCADAQTFP